MSTSDPLQRHTLLSRLTAARELAGLSQEELGGELGPGYGRATVSKIERGVKELEPTVLERWAAACGVHMDFFWMDFAAPSKRVEPLPESTSLHEAVEALKGRIADAIKAGKK